MDMIHFGLIEDHQGGLDKGIAVFHLLKKKRASIWSRVELGFSQPITSKEAVSNCLKWLHETNGVVALSLDLGLEIFGGKDALLSLCDMKIKNIIQKKKVPEHLLGGIVIGITLIDLVSNDLLGPDKAAILIMSSQRGNASAFRILQTYAEEQCCTDRIKLSQTNEEQGLKDLEFEEVEDCFSVLAMKLEDLSPSFSAHKDPIINNALTVYSKPWREHWPCQYFHWSHDDIEGNGVSRYRQEIGNWLGIGSELSIQCAKAIAMICKGADKLAWYKLSKSPDYNPQRVVKAITLKRLFELFIDDTKIGFENISDDSLHYLPVVPSLPFFTSLRMFYLELCKQAKPQKIKLECFHSSNRSVYSLRIRLSDTRCIDNEMLDVGPFDLSKKFTNKNVWGNTCKCLNSLLYCNTEGIDVFDDCNVLCEWKKLFDHLDKVALSSEMVDAPPICVYFTQYTINLIWMGGEIVK